MPTAPLWERVDLRQIAGNTLRPGGFTLTDRAAKAADLAPGWKVLDIGCGRGATVARLRSRYGAWAIGLEPSPKQLSACSLPACSVVQGTAEALPFADGCFDMIFCECVLSLTQRPDRVLQDYARVLKPEGHLMISDLTTPTPRMRPLSTQSCAQGALAQTDLRHMTETSGFTILAFEDHTQLLTELAAKLILAGETCSCERNNYSLLIAQKQRISDA